MCGCGESCACASSPHGVRLSRNPAPIGGEERPALLGVREWNEQHGHQSRLGYGRGGLIGPHICCPDRYSCFFLYRAYGLLRRRCPMESVHIWRLEIYSPTINRVRLHSDDLRDMPLINCEQAKPALTVQARGPGRPPPHLCVAIWQSGNRTVLQRRPRAILTPPRNERCPNENTRQGTHA